MWHMGWLGKTGLDWRRCLARLAGLCLALTLGGCSPDDKPGYQPAYTEMPPPDARTLILGVHPLHSPHLLFSVYQPLVDYLNHHIPDIRLRLEASQDYADFERKIELRHFHFALPNPYQTIESRQHGYRIFAKMGDDANFRGILIVRKDSGLIQPADLRGKAVSYPAPTALAATMLPQWFLHEAGLNVRKDLINHYVGSQESSIMNVYLGKSAAGATWPPPWRAFVKEHPDIAARLEVKWQTPSLVNHGLVSRDDIAPELVARVRELLLQLDRSVEGRAILARMELSRFEAADDRSYQPVVDFLARFERAVRQPKEP